MVVITRCYVATMALCMLWTAEAERDPSMLSVAIHHSLQTFGYDGANLVQAKVLQTILQGRDVFVSMQT